MAPIKRTNIENTSITILTVSGVFTYEDTINALDDFFNNGVTPYLLWDFTNADVSGITQEDMELIIEYAKSNAPLRKNGRTAIVVNHDLAFGLSRMYDTLSEIREHPITHCVFRDMDKAKNWLNSDG